jgi:hypothetical protein
MDCQLVDGCEKTRGIMQYTLKIPNSQHFKYLLKIFQQHFCQSNFSNDVLHLKFKFYCAGLFSQC